MLIPKSFTFALPRDDGTPKAGALGHGMVARKEALVLSFGRGLTPQMTRSTFFRCEYVGILNYTNYPLSRAFAKWITLTQSLSGLFCASLNFVDSTRTTRPVVSFEPAGDHPGGDGLHLLHGALPGEVVCTENLTPFLKLLPCKGKAGISSLFDGHKLFDAAWQSMSVDMRPICPPEGECVVQIEQTVDMVLDIERSKRPRCMLAPS